MVDHHHVSSVVFLDTVSLLLCEDKFQDHSFEWHCSSYDAMLFSKFADLKTKGDMGTYNQTILKNDIASWNEAHNRTDAEVKQWSWYIFISEKCVFIKWKRSSLSHTC